MANERVVHIIDDDDAVRDSLAFMLESADLKVRAFESALAFTTDPAFDRRRLHRHRHPNAGNVGDRTARSPQQRGVTIPVIAITGHGDVPLAVEAMKLGAFDFIEKPYDDERLLTVRARGTRRTKPARPGRRTKGGRRRQARQPVAARAAGARRARRRERQQDNRLRPRHQSADGRDLSRQRHGQDGRRQPLRARPDGDHRRRLDRARRRRRFIATTIWRAELAPDQRGADRTVVSFRQR